jgi:hypothetical protein
MAGSEYNADRGPTAEFGTMLAAGSGRIGKAGSEIGAVFGTIRAEHLSIRICYGAMDTHVAFVHAQSVESPSIHAHAIHETARAHETGDRNTARRTLCDC